MAVSELIPRYTTPEAFQGMRAAGRLAAEVLQYIAPFVVEGARTEDLDTLCHDFICARGAISAPLGYRGYPKSVCISHNHVVCHGIPGAYSLRKGDILNIDVTVILEGWYGDTSTMFSIGKISSQAQRLMDVTQEALQRGISAVRPGNHFGDIGHAIQTWVESQGFSVVRDFCGHGIGRIFHGPPEILHVGRPGTGPRLEEGMFFTIEPMVNLGTPDVRILGDGWTAITRDRKLSAQFEHTLGVTAEGCEIFTALGPLDCAALGV